MYALLYQLVNVAGVTQADITIGDPTGLWVNELYNTLHGPFPNVKYLDAAGHAGPHQGDQEHRAALLERSLR